MTIRPVAGADLGWMLELNRQHETDLSPLSTAGMRALTGASYRALVAEPEAGFLLSFDQDATYDSPNFLWFRARLPRFVYVDRVAISAAHRRKGLAGALYQALFAAARGDGHSHVVCEVNAVPPNPGSDRFHTALGFSVMGEGMLDDGAKKVRYYARDLAANQESGHPAPG
ncbi:MAG: GNAT family N-acetyltransferase [Pseudomonadota bacterium]